MNTNIEPGCLCMDVHPENFGQSFKAMEVAAKAWEPIFFEGNEIMSEKSPLWRINEFIDWGDGLMAPFESERFLRRIDGHTEDKQTETVKEKVDG